MTDPLNPSHDEPAEGPRDADFSARVRRGDRPKRRRRRRRRPARSAKANEIFEQLRDAVDDLADEGRPDRPRVLGQGRRARRRRPPTRPRRWPTRPARRRPTRAASSPRSRGPGPRDIREQVGGRRRRGRADDRRGRCAPRTPPRTDPGHRTRSGPSPAALDPYTSRPMSVRPIVMLGDPAAAPQGQAGRRLRQVPPRAPRRPRAHDARRAGRGPRRAPARRGDAGLRHRGRGPPLRAGQPAGSSARPATIATSRAACRSRATSPT